jgi:hypothetical protein
MLEAGLVILIQANPTVAALVTGPSGFGATLPKDWLTATRTAAWTYRSINDKDPLGLRGEHGFCHKRLEVNSFGTTDDIALTLDLAIRRTINAWSGTLSDTDPSSPIAPGTLVDHIEVIGQEDFYDEENRSYRRMTEYRIMYYQF